MTPFLKIVARCALAGALQAHDGPPTTAESVRSLIRDVESAHPPMTLDVLVQFGPASLDAQGNVVPGEAADGVRLVLRYGTRGCLMDVNPQPVTHQRFNSYRQTSACDGAWQWARSPEVPDNLTVTHQPDPDPRQQRLGLMDQSLRAIGGPWSVRRSQSFAPEQLAVERLGDGRLRAEWTPQGSPQEREWIRIDDQAQPPVVDGHGWETVAAPDGAPDGASSSPNTMTRTEVLEWAEFDGVRLPSRVRYFGVVSDAETGEVRCGLTEVRLLSASRDDPIAVDEAIEAFCRPRTGELVTDAVLHLRFVAGGREFQLGSLVYLAPEPLEHHPRGGLAALVARSTLLRDDAAPGPFDASPTAPSGASPPGRSSAGSNTAPPPTVQRNGSPATAPPTSDARSAPEQRSDETSPLAKRADAAGPIGLIGLIGFLGLMGAAVASGVALWLVVRRGR